MSSHAEFKFDGVKEAAQSFQKLADAAPVALSAALLELGLFGERETKIRTRVDTGRARASIGHYTPSDLTANAGPGDAAEAQAAAYFQSPSPYSLEVSWGSRVVYVPVLNYRLGDLMFEQGMQLAIEFAPQLVFQYLQKLV